MNPKTKKVPCEMEQLQEIGVMFRNRRLDMKKTFLDVEKKSGISSYTISKLEKWELTNSSLLTLNKVAKVLGLKVNISVTDALAKTRHKK